MATSLLLELATSDSLIKCKTGIVLVAHSMGGKIASAILASGTNLSIKALILLAPAPPGPIGLESDEWIARSHAYDSLEIAKYAIKERLTLVHASKIVLSELAEDAVSMSPEAKAHWMQYGIDEDAAPRLAAASDRTKKTKIRLLAGTLNEVETVQQIRLVTIPAFKRSGFEDVQILEVHDCGHLLPVEESGVSEVTRVFLEVMGSYFWIFGVASDRWSHEHRQLWAIVLNEPLSRVPAMTHVNSFLLIHTFSTYSEMVPQTSWTRYFRQRWRERQMKVLLYLHIFDASGWRYHTQFWEENWDKEKSDWGV
jgi:hypothetical protein